MSDQYGDKSLVSASSTTAAGMAFERVMPLLYGAAIIGWEVDDQYNIHLKLTGGRVLIVQATASDSRLALDLDGENNWTAPIPFYFHMENPPNIFQYGRIIGAFNQLYTIFFWGLQKELPHLRHLILTESPQHLDSSLREDDRLHFVSSGSGSVFFDIIPKSKAAASAALLLALSTGRRGRELLFRRLEAETRIKESSAEIAEIEVAGKRLKLIKERAELLREGIKIAKDLSDFEKKYIADRPDNDPVKLLFRQASDIFHNPGEA